ncbi:hypothetical protein [Anaerosporomusa subterranea]|nr:hypothetical protein [Anaerosporomusa subterranea]
MMRKITAFLVLAFTLVAFSTSAFAWGPKIDERPDSFRQGRSQGYFIWRDQNGFHLWTSTTNGQRHVFTGTITTDGDRFEVKAVDLENSAKTPFARMYNHNRPNRQDSIKIDHDRDTIKFRFNNSGRDVDGITFRTIGGSKVKFDLYMDGKRIDPSEIFIGEEGWHPGRSVFTMYK